MGNELEFTGPEPYVIIGSIVAVWALEHFGRARFGPQLAARLGFPLPAAQQRIATNPAMLPDNWFTNFVPLGNETWLMQDDATHWCFGVLRAERANGELVLTMQRLVPLAWIASIAGMFSVAPYVVEDDRNMMYLSAVVYTLLWLFQILRSYLSLGKLVVEVGERVENLAQLHS
jgi:hypothetical protein